METARAFQHNGSITARVQPQSSPQRSAVQERLIAYSHVLESAPIWLKEAFISWSMKDQKFVNRLCHYLDEHNVQYWLAAKELLPGADIYNGIENGVRNARKFLLIGSLDALTSSFVDYEIVTALEKERRLRELRKRKVGAIIPITIDSYMLEDWQEGYSASIRTRLAANFIGWENWENDEGRFEREAERVVRALREDPDSERHASN